MSKPKTTSTTLVVTTGIGTITDKAKLAKFQLATVEQIALVDLTEAQNVKRRVAVGLALMCIRDSLERGKWLPWLKKNAAGKSQRHCYNMIGAAEAFLEKTKGASDDLLAITRGDFSIALKEGKGSSPIATALDKFVGDQSWGELLDAHGIKEKKKLGGARNVTPAAPEELADAEQLYLGAREEIGSVIQRAEELFLKENRLQHLVAHPDEVRGVIESLRSLASKVEEAAAPLLSPKK